MQLGGGYADEHDKAGILPNTSMCKPMLPFLQVLAEPYSPEAGTLTRTMKPRRAAILSHYAPQVAALTNQL